MQHDCMSLVKTEAPIWLSQACYLLTSVNLNSGVVKGTGCLLGEGGGGSYVKGDMYLLTFNLNHSDCVFALSIWNSLNQSPSVSL